jgi:hypothetical protein
MNYLQEILAFNRWKEVNHLPATAIALWYEMMTVCNKCGWQKEFTVPNGLLQISAGLSRKQFENARLLLIQKGRITYKKSNSVNQAGKYSIIQIVQNGQQEAQQKVHQEEQQEGEQEEHTTGTLFKHKQNNKKPSCPKQVYDEERINFKLANRLYKKILENNSSHKKPNHQKWADDIRLMMERDNRSEEQIKYLIDWCQRDSFWKVNILSPSKLREKFDQLVLKVKQDRQKQPQLEETYRSEKIDVDNLYGDANELQN